MKKLLCMLLSVLFMTTMLAPGFCLAAEEEPFEPPVDIDEYTLTSTITATLSISGNTATVGGRVSAKNEDTSCSLTVKLQKKINGSWTTVKTWTASGTLSASVKKTYIVTSGSYRTCVTATLKRSGSSEHPVKYSATKTC